jgi:hypothetical protein
MELEPIRSEEHKILREFLNDSGGLFGFSNRGQPEFYQALFLNYTKTECPSLLQNEA